MIAEPVRELSRITRNCVESVPGCVLDGATIGVGKSVTHSFVTSQGIERRAIARKKKPRRSGAKFEEDKSVRIYRDRSKLHANGRKPGVSLIG
jgi:hypothetical protein